MKTLGHGCKSEKVALTMKMKWALSCYVSRKKQAAIAAIPQDEREIANEVFDGFLVPAPKRQHEQSGVARLGGCLGGQAQFGAKLRPIIEANVGYERAVQRFVYNRPDVVPVFRKSLIQSSAECYGPGRPHDRARWSIYLLRSEHRLASACSIWSSVNVPYAG